MNRTFGAETEQLVTALKPVDAVRCPPASKNKAIKFDAVRGRSRLICDPVRQKEGYDCPAHMPTE